MPEAEVVVIDDGSSDNTARVAESLDTTLIRLVVNLGVGGAMQAGYLYALRSSFDVAVQIDADGQHDASEAWRVVAPVIAGEADIAVGSRWLGRGNYKGPLNRRVGMRLLAFLVSRKVHTDVTDTTSGFRACGKKAIALFAQRYPPEFPEAEAIVIAYSRGLKVIEVPVAMRERTQGMSSILGIRTIYYMLRVGLGLFFDTRHGGI